MSNRSQGRNTGVNWTLVVAIASIVAVAIAYWTSPEDSTMRRVVKEAPDVVAAVPDRARRLRQQLRERLLQARAEFQRAKVESERVLVRELEEAKKTGHLPPV